MILYDDKAGGSFLPFFHKDLILSCPSDAVFSYLLLLFACGLRNFETGIFASNLKDRSVSLTI